MDERERAHEILDRLRDEYPEADTTLDYDSPYQLLVATILSAQCTDERVNAVTPDLFDAYPTAEAMADADREHVAEMIHSTGFYESKTDYLLDGARWLVDEHGGDVPRSMEALTEHPGVGRKTANVVLSNAFGVDEGVAVDTHVGRLSGRLELSEHDGPEAIERDLMELLPEEDWRIVSHLLIFHGRAICSARSPDCDGCVLEGLCPSAHTFDD